MNINVGLVDQALRISVGTLLLVLAISGAIGAWAYLGLIPLFTGLTAKCPIYALFDVRT